MENKPIFFNGTFLIMNDKSLDINLFKEVLCESTYSISTDNKINLFEL